MTDRRVPQLGVLLWVFLGVAIAGPAWREVNADASLFVGAATVLGPLAALAAFVLLGRRADRAAGLALLASAVVTPTYMAYALNLPVLLVGLVLLAAPQSLRLAR